MTKHVFIIYGEPATGKSNLAECLDEAICEVYDNVILTFENSKKYAIEIAESRCRNFVMIIQNYEDEVPHKDKKFSAKLCLIQRLKICCPDCLITELHCKKGE